jgi:uncharacterized protein (DUF983 family)
VKSTTADKYSPFYSGISCKCPACGKGKLFSDQIEVLPNCVECDADLKPLDSGDASAVFVVFIMGILVIAACFWVQFSFWPPIWLQIIIWIPILVILPLVSLKPVKGILIALQYFQQQQTEEKTPQS